MCRTRIEDRCFKRFESEILFSFSSVYIYLFSYSAEFNLNLNFKGEPAPLAVEVGIPFSMCRADLILCYTKFRSLGNHYKSTKRKLKREIRIVSEL